MERRLCLMCSMVLRRASTRLVWSKRAVRRGVDALVAVVPTDSVARVRVVVDDLLDYPAPRAVGPPPPRRERDLLVKKPWPSLRRLRGSVARKRRRVEPGTHPRWAGDWPGAPWLSRSH